MKTGPERRLVVTADDFGLAREVNEAVERAHVDGILTAASLMVAEPWAADAARRARRLGTLAVGLHVTLVERRPLLPPAEIPDLVTADGLLRTDLARYGAEIFFRRRVREQVAAEVTAQFEAFLATGLPLDHVNAHQHFHLHPTVARLILAIGPRYGMRALRVPVEPSATLSAVEPTRRGIEASLAAPYAKLLRRRAVRAGVTVPDQVFGLAWTGHMRAERVSGLLRALPAGLTEIYGHPATAGGFNGAAADYEYAQELSGLLSWRVREAAEPISRGGFGQFLATCDRGASARRGSRTARLY